MRLRLLLPGMVVVAGFVVLVALGGWQLERKAWKDNLIATLAQRMAEPPSSLPLSGQWQALSPADEFRRFILRGAFAPGREARVFSGSAGLREDVKGPGYFVFAPLRLPDGSTMVVNRGYVDNRNPDASLAPIALPLGAIEIVAALRWPERPGLFVSAYTERQDLWFVRDHRAMAERYGWGEVAPFYVEMESPAPTGGVPRPGALTVKLSSNHLGYALTWFGLAAVLVVMFGSWVLSRRRDLRLD
jgi:surfeit locus 1 family protein